MIWRERVYVQSVSKKDGEIVLILSAANAPRGVSPQTAFEVGQTLIIETVDDKEIPMKQWVMNEAERLGLKPTAIYNRLSRGLYPHLKKRYVSKRTVFVKEL